MAAAIALGLLGPFELRIGEGPPVALGGTRQRALLAVLGLSANEVISTDRLVHELWGETPPQTAVHTVQVFVSRLRSAMGEAGERLVTRAPGYLLEVGIDEIDAERCLHLYELARSALAAGDAPAAGGLLEEALALWRGPPLAEFTYEPFAQAAIARLDELRLSCREEQIQAELGMGRHAEVVPKLEALVREQPLRERPRGQLMLALYRSGRQADALDAFQQTRRMLVEELAVEPGASLRELEQAILRQDPSLDLEATAPSAQRPSIAGEIELDTRLAVDESETAAEAPQGVDAEGLVRRNATVLVASLAAEGDADPETVRTVIATARTQAEDIVISHGGTFAAGLAGELVWVFGVPVVREDDAMRALRAAGELRQQLTSRRGLDSCELTLRIGVATGEVVAERSADIYGAPLSRGIALAHAAQNGEILLANRTRELVRDAIAAELLLDGTAWRLLSLTAPEIRPAAVTTGPMVGREDEMEAACSMFAHAARSQEAHLLSVVGDAGIGKSRLAQELCTRLSDEATILTGRCLSYGEGVALWPLREALSMAAGEESRDAIRALLDGAADADVVADIIATALGLAPAESVGEQVPWALRRLLEVLATRSPVILVIEDAHWAEPPLLDLIDYLVDWLRAPALLLCLARPELLDARPRWGGGRSRVSSLVLQPLPDGDTLSLLSNQLGTRQMSAGERARVLETAEGNPLFIEQLMHASAEDPGWERDEQIPPTIHSLLAARLDRLGPGERGYIERAALIGREFWPAAVVQLLPPQAHATAEQHLGTLVRRGLIQPHRTRLADEEQLRFHHILIRDVAYRSTPKELRSELHEAFAEWLASRGEAYDEFVGYHLERAFRYRREIGRQPAEVLALAARAADSLARAGRRALSRGDTNAAVNLLRSAADLLEAAEQNRPDVLLDLGSALSETGDFADAEQVLRTALDAADRDDAPAVHARALIELSYWRSRAEPTAHVQEILRVAEQAIEVFERSHDEGGLARAWLHVAWAHWIESHSAEMEPALEHALEHAERANERRERSRALTYLARCAVYGPRPVDDAVARCNAILARANGDVTASAFTEAMLAVLEAMDGRFRDARTRWRRSKHRLAEMGLSHTVAVIQISYGFIELLDGTAADAEAEVTDACATFERIGDHGRLSSAAAVLARLHYAQGRYDAAAHYSRVAEDAASAEDIEPQVLWRGTRAKILARTGHAEQAEELTTTAVMLAEATDFLMLHGDALSDRAEVMAQLGRTESAMRDLEQATGVYHRKGIVLSAEGRRRSNRSDLAANGTSTGVI
jgi:DNA-binding SARP family transcriptional activator/tetratricopeptide (TPR) repeat protein